MENILVYLKDEYKNRILNLLTSNYFIIETYFDKYNYNSVILRNKANIIIINNSLLDYELLIKLSSLNKIIIVIKDSESNANFNADFIYFIDKNKLYYLNDYLNIILKDYKKINHLSNILESYKEKEEEARLVKRAKLKLMSEGMSEEESYNMILKNSMKKRITKKEEAIIILNK